MKTLHLNIKKLSTVETVRYSGPLTNEHGVYTITLLPKELGSEDRAVEIHLSLEAIIQLKQRIDAAFQHMITH